MLACWCRPPCEAPRSSLSPAGGAPSPSHHMHMPHLFGQLPPKPLRIRAVTFNMARRMPTELPEELLGRAGCPDGLDKYDIVVVGTQESGSSQVSTHNLLACLRQRTPANMTSSITRKPQNLSPPQRRVVHLRHFRLLSNVSQSKYESMSDIKTADCC